MANNSESSDIIDKELDKDAKEERTCSFDSHGNESDREAANSNASLLKVDVNTKGEDCFSTETSLTDAIVSGDVAAHMVENCNKDKGNDNMQGVAMTVQDGENMDVVGSRGSKGSLKTCNSGSESSHQSTSLTMTDEQKSFDSQPGEDNMNQKPVSHLPGSSQYDPSHSMYYLKRFKWRREPVQIVTQNENGPCPLLAIANVLVLSKRIAIPPMQEYITAYQLMEYIGDYILSSGPKNVDEAIILNYEQNMQDAISIMYKLQTGIDVNVKFTSPRHFELTQESLVFDILNIGLYHGWLIDPQDIHISNAIGNLSYNQLVEKIIKSKDDNSNEQTVQEGLLAESFLEQTASQLTYHGLCELNSEIKEEELCVFFRNNHFNTLYKHKGELFLLVTDQGYLNQSKIIWETLANVDGESQFVNEDFYTVGPLTTPQTYPKQAQKQGELSQEDRDYLIALSLQEESHASGSSVSTSQHTMQSNSPPKHQELKDLELAQRLQEEEDRMAREQQEIQNQILQQRQRMQNQHSHDQQMSRQHREVPTETRGDKCTIL